MYIYIYIYIYDIPFFSFKSKIPLASPPEGGEAAETAIRGKMMAKVRPKTLMRWVNDGLKDQPSLDCVSFGNTFRKLEMGKSHGFRWMFFSL